MHFFYDCFCIIWILHKKLFRCTLKLTYKWNYNMIISTSTSDRQLWSFLSKLIIIGHILSPNYKSFCISTSHAAFFSLLVLPLSFILKLYKQLQCNYMATYNIIPLRLTFVVSRGHTVSHKVLDTLKLNLVHPFTSST